MIVRGRNVWKILTCQPRFVVDSGFCETEMAENGMETRIFCTRANNAAHASRGRTRSSIIVRVILSLRLHECRKIFLIEYRGKENIAQKENARCLWRSLSAMIISTPVLIVESGQKAFAKYYSASTYT